MPQINSSLGIEYYFMQFPVHVQSFCLQDQFFEVCVPDAKFVQDAYKSGNIQFPYWSQVWPSAIALSKFLLCNPHYTAQKMVIELAAGLGLPSIVAAHTANSVVCSDYVPEAIELINQSIQHNSLQNVQAALLNWYSLPTAIDCDVLLLSDVSYDPTLFAVQEKVIQWFLKNGCTVIISTPQRLMAKEFMATLPGICVQKEEWVVQHQAKDITISVLVIIEKA